MIGRFFQFLTRLVLWCVLIIVVCFVWMRWAEPRLLSVTEAEIRSGNLPGMADGLRIVQFSDTHFGFDYSEEDFARAVEKIREQSPHIVVFTGDLFEEYAKYPADEDELIRLLSSISAPYGKYAVLGNHDYGRNAQAESIRVLEAGGFTVLRNETVTLTTLGITITGIDDCFFGIGSRHVFTEQDPEDYHLVLAHEPDIFATVDSSQLDLMLAGHTHGGQVRLPLLGELILPYLGKDYPMGEYALRNERGSRLFVSRGLGTSKLPLRFLCMPEIAVITLRTA